ncbi:phosphotransferase [Bacillus sp. BGMRC 2118]|nr:phosphotransferase [Bacillus sp. BGMRC 2118]
MLHMMKLSLMKNVVQTVGSDWKSNLAEEIINYWDYELDSVYYWRASANFIFVCNTKGKRAFLRFNSVDERSREQIQSEISIVNYLSAKQLEVAKPILSKHQNYIEKVETTLGVFYASLFEGLEGEQLEMEQLNSEQFHIWGKALGKLHEVSKGITEEKIASIRNRHSWKDHANLIKKYVTGELVEEAESVISQLESLDTTSQNFGLIHFDFELDNIYWDNGSISILDFDDASHYWYVADIAFALRDLHEPSGEYFEAFMSGYRSQTDVDEDMLAKLPLFARFHELYLYARLKRALDLELSSEHPEWVNNLVEKLTNRLYKLAKNSQKTS